MWSAPLKMLAFTLELAAGSSKNAPLVSALPPQRGPSSSAAAFEKGTCEHGPECQGLLTSWEVEPHARHVVPVGATCPQKLWPLSVDR